MEIARVFNNNLILALDEQGQEVILTGRGLGFQARPGQPVDTTKVVRRFIPSDGRDPDHLATLLAGIPPEHIHLVSDSLAAVGLNRVNDNPALLIALADHVSFALRRTDLGVDLNYPLAAEVTNLYGEEYRQATTLLAELNRRSGGALADEEAVGIALHLVNAGFATGDLSYTYTMTGVIQQMIAVIEQTYGLTLPGSSVNVGRFITHLRYLFARIHQHRQLNDEHSCVGSAIRRSYPEAVECAVRLAALLEVRLGAGLTEDELSYLALHVARVATEEG